MKKIILPILFIAITFIANAQYPNGGSAGKKQNATIGHLYGKVVGSDGKAIDAATVQLLQSKMDSMTQTKKNVSIRTQITQSNGDFSMEDLPLMGSYTLKISNAGYKTYTQAISFSQKRRDSASNNVSEDVENSNITSSTEKDLGNIKLITDAKQLAEVTVTSTKPLFTMGVDRKIFNVEKNIVTSGQTATEVMKNIPSVNVDIDGNVTLRNAAPTIYLDGRPTTLTLDQIPADAISSVELITNPSAKFEASSGNAGIINIVLKKNNKIGYNGNVRAGVDSRGKINTGLDLNIREKKFNLFTSLMYNQRKSISTSTIDRTDLVKIGNSITQDGTNTSNGHFGFARFGADYFIDNRNTLTFTQTLGGGLINGDNNIIIDSLRFNNPFAIGNSLTNSQNKNTNSVSSLDYKHTYAKQGKEWSSFITYNTNKSNSYSNLNTTFLFPDNTKDGTPNLQQTIADGTNKYLTIQTDYTNPITKNAKIEMGARAAVRKFASNNTNSFFDSATSSYITSALASSNYAFTDAVYAGYATYSDKIGKPFIYQIGLRAESSNYTGSLAGQASSFNTSYPISLFPTAFLTYKLSDNQDVQFNYSRKINRPSFFQLLPYTDFSNPQNLVIGNPALKPSFTNSYELNYDKIFNNKNSLLASVYYKSSTDLVTTFQYQGINPITNTNTVYSTYTNANSSQAYGAELTSKNTIFGWWDVLTNVNVYDAKINGSNIQNGLSSERVSWFAKMNNSFKLPANFTLQLSGDYQSKSVLPQGSSNGGNRGGYGGGGGYGGQTTLSAQGYVNPNYGVDAAIKKDFGKTKNISATLSMNDIFRTKLYSYYSATVFYSQTYDRRRDPQILRLNLSYRFGKMDASLFKRKNTKNTDNGITPEM